MELDRTSLVLLLVAVALLGYMLGYTFGWLEAPAIVRRTVYMPPAGKYTAAAKPEKSDAVD